MKTKNASLLLLLAGTVFCSTLLFSCKKDDDDQNNVSAKTALLSAHSWVSTDFLINDTSFFAFIPACETDNRFTFTATGNFTEDEGPTKCNPTDPQIASASTWSFAANETQLIIGQGTADELIADIDRLDADTLVVSTSSYDSTFATTTVITRVFSR